MLREGMDYLDGVVYTHEHKDHLAGMDDVRPFNFLKNSQSYFVLRSVLRWPFEGIFTMRLTTTDMVVFHMFISNGSVILRG